MPKREDLYVNELIPRYETLKDGKITGLTYAERARLGRARDPFFMELGMNVTENGLEGQIGDVPRVFIMGKNKEGHDTVFSPAEKDIKIGDSKFWEQVLLGNVFAYPVGSEDPVQLQLDKSSGRPKLTYSKPVTSEMLPQLPKPANVNWFHRFANFITFGNAYKERIERFDKFTQSAENNKLKFASMKESRKGVKALEENQHQEEMEKEKEYLAKKAAEEERKRLEAIEKEKQRLSAKAAEEERLYQSNLNSAISQHNYIKTGLKNMTNVLQPKPFFDTEIEKITEVVDKNGTVKVKGKSGLYTKEMFKNLDVYDTSKIDLSKIKMGKKEEPVTNEEFASVAFFALWDPKNALPEVQRTLKDKWAERSLEEMGLDKSQAGSLLTGQRRNFWTADLFIVPPRDSEGSYFKTVTNTGRKDAVEAFQAYPGDKTKLANILAFGINAAVKDMCATAHPVSMTEQQKGIMACTSQLLNLMDKDPELKDLALKQGLDPENLKAAQGMREFHKMQLDRDEAEYKMAKALKNGEPITQEDKVKYTKTILKARLMTQQLHLDNERNAIAAEKKIDSFENSVVFTDKDTQNKWREDPDSRPYPGKGKIHMDTYTALAASMLKAFTPTAETLKNMGDKNGPKHLDALTDEIIRQEGLAEKPAKELFKDLNEHQISSNFDLATSAMKAAKTLTGKQEQKDKQLNNPHIQDPQNNYDGPGLN